MDKLKKLQALTGQGGRDLVEPQQPRYDPTDSGSDSDEYLTSGRGIKNNGNKSAVIYTPLGDPPKEFTGYDLKQGQLALEGESFVPWAVVRKYPYTYVGVADKQRVCERFFDGRKLSNERWNFFYIYRGPSDSNLQPIFLIPTRQFEEFLGRINQKLKTNLTVPTGGSNGSFQVTFMNDGTPQPRYLGCSINNEMAESLRRNVPPHYFKLDGEPGAVGTPSDRSLAAFRAKIELMTQAQKGKKVVNKEKQKKERIEKQQAWNHSIKRVQRYLGLRESKSARVAAIRTQLQSSGLEWAAYDDAVKEALAKLPPPGHFKADEPAPYKQESSVVFVCVDVEAYERNARLVTEIGVATLDTNDLPSLIPGEGGVEWMKKIRARHFRISDYKHLNNTEFVAGCADKFEFGESEFINLKDAPYIVSTCFKPPFSKPTETEVSEEPKRNIILVGHDVGADINFLQSIGYDVYNLSNLMEQADTAIMWRSLKREQNPRNLASILAEVGITGWNLHNAGNDAVYTLQAMIAIAIKHIDEKQKKREVKDFEKKIRISEFVKEAVEIAVEKEEGWSSAGENSDGGAPVPILQAPPKVKKSQTYERNNPSASSSKDSRGPWKAAPSSDASWGTPNSHSTSTSQYGANTRGWGATAGQWGQNGQYNGQWGANNNNQWEGAAAASKPGLSQLPAAAPPFTGSSTHHGDSYGRTGPWHSESPLPLQPVASPALATGPTKLDQLMKKTSISKEQGLAAATDGAFDTSRWTKPKPTSPQPIAAWTVLNETEGK